jgi:hypothetical protein
MEPRYEDPQKSPEPGTGKKPQRFRIVKLEERIAPSKGGNGNHGVTHGPATACGLTCPAPGTVAYPCTSIIPC